MSRGFRQGPITYDYVREYFEDNEIFRPRIPVRLQNGSHSFRTLMLLDSGADISFIPPAVAATLELKLEDKEISVGASGPFETWNSVVEAWLIQSGVGEYPVGKIGVKVPVEEPAGGSGNQLAYLLLGRIPMFDLFDIHFKQAQRKVFLYPASHPLKGQFRPIRT